MQKLELSTSFLRFRYDFKAGAPDVGGIMFPKIIGDSNGVIGGVLMKVGDFNRHDQYIVDVWANRKWGKNHKFYTGIEIGRIFCAESRPWDYLITKLSYGPFTVEAGILAFHPVTTMVNSKDATYAWAAYHPKHAFIALGKQIDTYWAFVGTKNLTGFGNLTFANYDLKTGNFWFKSQTGIGEINQAFFNQDLYVEATSYLVIPAFYYKHFSPLTTKGTFSIKLEGRRVRDIQNYEIMAGHIIGNDILQIGVGLNSEYKDKLKIAPVIELYKSWQFKSLRGSVELRYDLLYQALNAYTIIKIN